MRSRGQSLKRGGVPRQATVNWGGPLGDMNSPGALGQAPGRGLFVSEAKMSLSGSARKQAVHVRGT